MGIKDEIERQKNEASKKLRQGTKLSDEKFAEMIEQISRNAEQNDQKTKDEIAPLIRRLESQREPEFQAIGNFVYDSALQSWIVRFPSLWASDDQRRRNRLPALTNADSPWRQITKQQGFLRTQIAANRDSNTGVYRVTRTQDGNIAIFVQRLYAEEPTHKTLRMWERFDEIGVYGTTDEAFDNFFPIYAREVAEYEKNKAWNEEIGAEIDKWMGHRAKVFQDSQTGLGNQTVAKSPQNSQFDYFCPSCGQKNRISGAPETATIEISCGKCGYKFRVSGQSASANNALKKSNSNVKMWGTWTVTILLGLAASTYFMMFVI